MKIDKRKIVAYTFIVTLLFSCGKKEEKQEPVTQTTTQTVKKTEKKEKKPKLEEGQLLVEITDADGDYTNLRRTPNGQIVYQLPTSASYRLVVEEPTKGWWQIANNTVEKIKKKGKTKKVELPEGVVLVHSSVLSVETNNKEGQKLELKKAPNKDAEEEYSFSKPMEFRPVDIRGKWVKVSTIDNKRSGWIKIKNLK